MLRSRTTIGRWVLRSAGQVLGSVVATLAATTIYAGLRHVPDEIAPKPAAAVTTAGKFAARIVGAGAFEPPGPPLPLLSVIDWRPPATEGADWPAVEPVLADPGPKPGRLVHAVRHPGVQVATVLPPPRPVDRRSEDPSPEAAPAGRRNGVLDAAATVVGTASAAVGTATGSMMSVARGAVAFGGSVLDRVLP